MSTLDEVEGRGGDIPCHFLGVHTHPFHIHTYLPHGQSILPALPMSTFVALLVDRCKICIKTLTCQTRNQNQPHRKPCSLSQLRMFAIPVDLAESRGIQNTPLKGLVTFLERQQSSMFLPPYRPLNLIKRDRMMHTCVDSLHFST